MAAQTREIGQYVYKGTVANKVLDELLGKELGMIKDKLVVSGSLPIRHVTVVRTIREDDS